MISTAIQVVVLMCLMHSYFAYSYTVTLASYTTTSVSDGSWNNPAMWSGGTVPDASAEVIVNHVVSIPASAVIQVATLTVTGHLILESGATLQLPVPDSQVLRINGILDCADGAQIAGTTITNTFFAAGARYIHRQGPLGFIPIATWDRESTFQISGFVNDGYINLAHSNSWRQSFGHVEYDCPSQTVFVVDLNGHLRDIRGNLTIRNTNGKTLRLSTTQQATINIGGNLVI